MENVASIPADINPGNFFEDVLPPMAESYMQTNPLDNMDNTEFSIQFDLEGEGGGTWSIIVQDGKNLQVMPEAYENAKIVMSMSVDDWRKALTEGGSGMDMTAMMTDPKKQPKRSHYENLKRMKGILTVELKRDDGSIFPFRVKFNQEENPTLKIMMSVEDFAEINSGKANAQQLFMQGKIKLQGDMTMAMNLLTVMPI